MRFPPPIRAGGHTGQHPQRAVAHRSEQQTPPHIPPIRTVRGSCSTTRCFVHTDAAVTAAAATQPAWAALPALARGAILMTAANLLQERGSVVAADLVQEDKTLAEARGEVTRAVDVLRFFGSLGWTATGEMLPSGLPGTSVTTRREQSSRATRWRSSPPNSHPCPPPTLPATDSPRGSAPTASLARRTSRPGRRPASSRSTARPPGST
ncbi:aldehyde dehydrogenase family protein [Rhodococcus opacus]|nr:aldehyde dehydrogenase family protein [Rhodococcus opacus]